MAVLWIGLWIFCSSFLLSQVPEDYTPKEAWTSSSRVFASAFFLPGLFPFLVSQVFVGLRMLMPRMPRPVQSESCWDGSSPRIVHELYAMQKGIWNGGHAWQMH